MRPVGFGDEADARVGGGELRGDLLGAVAWRARAASTSSSGAGVVLGEDAATASGRCRSSLSTGITTETAGQVRSPESERGFTAYWISWFMARCAWGDWLGKTAPRYSKDTRSR